MVAHNKQNDFLSNKLNKSQFISVLGNCLQTKGFIVHQSSDDAGILIAKSAIELALAENVCIITAGDTDILVLLMYYFQPHMADIFLFSIASKCSKSGQKIVSLKNVIDVTDPFIKENIFFAHAWSGCDTTSSTYGHGKSTILKYLKENKEVREISKIFSDSSTSHLEILEAAAEFHSLRVHCQILKWKNEDQTDFSPSQWGWENCNESFEPIDNLGIRPSKTVECNRIKLQTFNKESMWC